MKEGEPSAIAAASIPHKRSRLRTAMAVCSWLYFLAVLIAWVTVYLGDWWWPATLFLFGPRWLLLLPLAPLLVAALGLRSRSLAVLLPVLLLILGPVMSFNVPWKRIVSSPPQGMQLRVLTCNMHHQYPHRAALDHLLDDCHPDVVAIQELRGSDSFDYFEEGQWYIERAPALFLASRHPIRAAERLGRESMTEPGSLMRYELETPAGTLTLFSLHFASPRDGLFEAMHHPSTGRADLAFNSEMRQRQSENLARLAEKTTGPVLLMGDFNTPVESVVFRRVWHGYRDAFTDAGWGWGFTFRGSKTSVRIDHILMSPGWYCSRCWVGPSVGSPHHPVVADLIWTSPLP